MRCLKFILLLIIFTGCEKVWTVEQIIKNDTGHDVVIKTYQEGKELESISISPSQNYAKISTKEHRNKDDVFILNSLADSVNIIFDNERLIIQSSTFPLSICPDIVRNILCLSEEYEIKDTGAYSICYLYSITEDDFNNAIPIESE